jgi:hypothetical protein
MKKLLIACFAALMLVAFTVPAMAADAPAWNFYGSARMSTFMTSQDKDASATGYSDKDLTWDLQGNSRIGARVKAGDVGGRFELGIGSSVATRLLYGTWNFGAGELLVGQGYTPLMSLVSNQVNAGDNDLVSFGGLYEGRKPMIRVSFAGFQFAAVKPSTATGNISAYVAEVTGIDLDPDSATFLDSVVTPAVMGYADIDTTLPKLEASYGLKLGPASINLMAGYNTFDVVDPEDNSEDITSYVYGIEAGANFGPAYLKGTYWGGKNVGNYGVYTDSDSFADFSGGDISDTDTFGYQLVIGFKVSDMLALEAGYGFVSSEDDIDGHDKDEARSYYGQATITLAKGVMLIPEIGLYDSMDSDTGADQGKVTYYGAKWQINF